MSTNGVIPTIPLGTGIKNIRIIVQTNALYAQTKLLPIAGNSSVIYKGYDDFFEELSVGVYRSNINVMTSGVYATGTAVFASVVNTNTLVIGGVTITATSGTPTSVQFKVGATDAATVVNAAACINALSTLNAVVAASPASVGSTTLNIACLVPGTIGNLVTITAGGGTITVPSTLTGGTDGNVGTMSHGL